MAEIFEVRIVRVANMPYRVRHIVHNKVVAKDAAFRKNFKGFAKITYITASKPRIKEVEPIEGTSIGFDREFARDNRDVDPNVF